MHNSIKNLSLIVFFLLLLSPFTNCSYIDTSVFDADQGSLDNGAPTISFNAPNPLRVTADVQLFTIYGNCSAGIYPETEIYWTLHNLSDQLVADSHSSGGVQFFASCVGNQYAIDIRLPCPGLTNVNQNCFGLIEPLKLKIHIQGYTASGGLAPGGVSTSNILTIVP